MASSSNTRFADGMTPASTRRRYPNSSVSYTVRASIAAFRAACSAGVSALSVKDAMYFLVVLSASSTAATSALIFSGSSRMSILLV